MVKKGGYRDALKFCETLNINSKIRALLGCKVDDSLHFETYQSSLRSRITS